MSDFLFGAAVEAAVQRAFDALLPDIIAGIRAALPEPGQPTPAEQGVDRFVKLDDACKMLDMHKTTLFRHERAGRLPKRRRMGGKSGYLLSDIRQIMAGLSSDRTDARGEGLTRKAKAA